MVFPVLADAALVAATLDGDDAPANVGALIREIVQLAERGGVTRFGDWALCAAVACALTEQLELFPHTAADTMSRWGAAALLIADRRFGEAADLLAEMGARADEALARLLSGRDLIAAGRATEGEAQLRRAIGFWQAVGATAYLAMAEDLLAKTA